MLFIDGSWLDASRQTFGERIRQADYRLNFEQLPVLLTEQAGRRLGRNDLDLAHSFYFCSHPVNVDPIDAAAVRKGESFRAQLGSLYYTVESYPVDYRGNRLRAADRLAQVSCPGFQLKEKCVDVALATRLVSLASSDAYDVALVVAGDRDFLPAFRAVRELGKRVVIASVRWACSGRLADAHNSYEARDADVIWLEDHLGELEYRPVKQLVRCASDLHVGPNPIWTPNRLAPGREYYCGDCREQFKERRLGAA
jgi:uncharacterized LabA/DUF88 family protein